MADFEISVTDHITGPSLAMARGLDALTSRLHATDKAMRELDRAGRDFRLRRAAGLDPSASPLDREASRLRAEALAAQRLGLARHRDAVQDAVAAERKLQQAWYSTTSLGRLARGGFDALRTGVNALATGVAGLAASVVGLGVAFAESAAESISFGQDARHALDEMFGGVEGDRQFGQLRAYAARFGQDFRETYHQFQALIAGGANRSEALALMQGAGDVGVRMGHDVGNELVHVMSQMMMRGKLQTRELFMAARAGVNLDAIKGEMAAARHVTLARLDEMMSGGQLSGREAVAAMQRVMVRQFSLGGPAGTAMQAHARTMVGSIDRIKVEWDLFKQSFMDSTAFEPLRDFLGRVATAMDGGTAQGREFKRILDGLFGDMFRGLNGVDPVKVFRDFTAAVETTADAIKGIYHWLSMAIEGWKLLHDVVGGKRVDVGSGRSSPASERSVQGGLRAEREGRAVTGPGFAARALHDFALGQDETRRGHGVGAAAQSLASFLANPMLFAIDPLLHRRHAPDRPATGAAVGAAGARGGVHVGAIHVHVTAAAAGDTPEALGSAVAAAAHRETTRLFSSVAATEAP